MKAAYFGCHFVDRFEVEGFRARGHEGDVEGDEARHFGGVQEVEALGEVGAPRFKISSDLRLDHQRIERLCLLTSRVPSV